MSTPLCPFGWGWRLAVLLIGALGLMLAVDRVTAGFAIYKGAVHALHLMVIVMPLGLCALWALNHARRAEWRMQQLRQRDRVTGLPDRQHFQAGLLRVLPQTGVLLLLDIDNFKGFNDARGRHAGDLCLMALAQRLRELTRGTDILGRLDGAVFGVYLPGAPVEVARDIGDRLSTGLVVLTEHDILRVTLSVGAVTADGLTPVDMLLRDADRALDRAKREGRARMILNERYEAA